MRRVGSDVQPPRTVPSPPLLPPLGSRVTPSVQQLDPGSGRRAGLNGLRAARALPERFPRRVSRAARMLPPHLILSG